METAEKKLNEEESSVEVPEETGAALPETAEQTEPEEEKPSPAQVLADFIRDESIHSRVIGKKKLMLHPPEGVPTEVLPLLLASVQTPEAEEALAQIEFVKGQKDLYYFENKMMTRPFAEIASMLEDKDILTTISTIARSDSMSYPRPTQFSKLMDYPFYFTMDEILGAVARMKLDERYSDIEVTTASNGGRGIYSTKYMSPKYARALIEQIEVEEDEWR